MTGRDQQTRFARSLAFSSGAIVAPGKSAMDCAAERVNARNLHTIGRLAAQLASRTATSRVERQPARLSLGFRFRTFSHTRRAGERASRRPAAQSAARRRGIIQASRVCLSVRARLYVCVRGSALVVVGFKFMNEFKIAQLERPAACVRQMRLDWSLCERV